MKRKIFSLLMVMAFCAVCWFGNGFSFDGKADTIMGAAVSLEDFGAYASDDEDDTEGIRQALATGCAIQLTKGTYDISDTLELTDQVLIGSATGTVLRANWKDKSKPIIRLNGRCVVSDLTIQFGDNILDYTESEGQRVAIWLGNKSPADGSQLKNIRFLNVGTGIYAPNKTNMGASRILVDTIYMPSFSYRGVDLQKEGQYGNTFSNVYLGGKDNLEKVRSAGFAAEGGEYNLIVEQLNLEHNYFDKALLLKNCYGARFGSIHFEATAFSGPNTGSVWIDNSDVHIDGITQYYNPIHYKGCGLIALANAGSQEGNRVSIGTVHLKDVNVVHPNNHPGNWDGFRDENAKDYKVFIRTAGAKGTFTVDVEAYVWLTWRGDTKHFYEAFPCDETGINYVSKGIH